MRAQNSRKTKTMNLKTSWYLAEFPVNLNMHVVSRVLVSKLSPIGNKFSVHVQSSKQCRIILICQVHRHHNGHPCLIFVPCTPLPLPLPLHPSDHLYQNQKLFYICNSFDFYCFLDRHCPYLVQILTDIPR